MVLGPPICFSILWAFLSHQAPMQVSPPNSHPRVRPPCPPFASARKEMDYQFARAPLDNLEWFTHKPKKNITHFHDPKPWRLFTWNLAALAALAFIFPHHISPNQMDSKTKYEKSPINSPRQIVRHDLSILLCPQHVFVDLNFPSHIFQSQCPTTTFWICPNNILHFCLVICSISIFPNKKPALQFRLPFHVHVWECACFVWCLSSGSLHFIWVFLIPAPTLPKNGSQIWCCFLVPAITLPSNEPDDLVVACWCAFAKFPMNPGRYVLPRGRRAVCLSEGLAYGTGWAFDFDVFHSFSLLFRLHVRWWLAFFSFCIHFSYLCLDLAWLTVRGFMCKIFLV